MHNNNTQYQQLEAFGEGKPPPRQGILEFNSIYSLKNAFQRVNYSLFHCDLSLTPLTFDLLLSLELPVLQPQSYLELFSYLEPHFNICLDFL